MLIFFSFEFGMDKNLQMVKRDYMENIIIKNKRVGTAMVRLWGIEFYRYVCARIREYRFITQIWRQPEGESELSLFYICYYRQTEHPHQFSLGYPVSLSPVISWK